MTGRTDFQTVARTFSRLEETSSSLKMIDELAEFFPKLSPEEARMVSYLMQGEVGSSHAGLDLGLAEKLAVRAISQAYGLDTEEIERRYGKMGDLGNVAESCAGKRAGARLSVESVFGELKNIAVSSGEGSQERKISLLAALLKRATPVEAKYLMRLVLGQLRLGVGEMTFLYGLAKAFTGTKEKKSILEKTFNVCSDLGEVAYRTAKEGVEAQYDVKPSAGIPIRMMLAQRIGELKEVRAHIAGALVAEYKYDGERIQAHICRSGEVILYSRRHENITHQFPDIVEALRSSFSGWEAIVEGEAVALDSSGKLASFQLLMKRRRKHQVAEHAARIPVRYFLFDLLLVDGKSFLDKPLTERKKELRERFSEKEGISFVKEVPSPDEDTIEDLFRASLEEGAEGVMIKDAQGPYEAGSRGWRWIKFKRDYGEGLADTFDLVVVGGTHGTGKRGGAYGSLLAASYDANEGTYCSFTKVGTGFTDEELEKMKKTLDKYKIKGKHARVRTGMEMDVWFEPAVVMEVEGAEITVSPVHATAEEKVEKGGLALRFPRFLRWREDKGPQQATSTEEIYRMYSQYHS